MKTSRLFRRISLGSATIWLALFVLAPNLLILVTSFLTRDEASFVAPAFSLDGYAKILSPVFLDVLIKSVYLAGTATLICLLAAYPFAWTLARIKSRHKGLLLLLVMIPFWTNSLIRTYAMVFVLKGKGLISQVLTGLGIAEHPVSFMYTEFAIFAGLTYTLLPFMILPLYSSIDKLDESMLEAAGDLGAGRFKAFVHVILPLTKPGIIAGCMMVFLPALGMFYIPDILGGGKHLIVGNFIKNQFLTARDWPGGSAASVLLTLIMLLLMRFYGTSSRRLGKQGGDEL
ncbi:spermidine/putrescine ABC transporter permease PotB [Salidesulfovibrio brasiliensis]|uniref:spermidine/putrescine ABC transporter permease PotB n=1 Tax=Salidesulfovibrio brasiliensis TaxID=221711 RepID=UPI0006D00560|nr:spermidine/putrescine ABC transporter permease PotB [Salidesulfovibrio brasiliensis]